MKMNNVLLLLMVIATVMGCGSPRGGGTAGGGAGGGGGVVGASVLTLAMTPTTLAAGATATVTATLVDGAGAPVANAKVIFSTSQTSDTFVGNFSTVQATTNANGIVSVVLTAGTVGGAATITAASSAVSASLIYTVNVGSLSLALTDPGTGIVVSNIISGSKIKVTATVLDSLGAPVVGSVVTFATDPLIGTIIPASASALTNATGKASVILSGVAAGATTVTSSVTLGATTLAGSASYSVSPVTLSTLSFGVNPLPANSSTTVSVTVSSGGVAVTSPVSVVFSSTCSTTGKATISSPVNTVAGVATATYVDKGCGASDTITATVSGATKSATLPITPASTGSVALSLIDLSTGLPATSMSAGGTLQLQAVVKDGAGVIVSSAVVTFATDPLIGSFNPTRATALTDATGTATLNLDGVAPGAATVTATVTIGAATLTGSAGYSVSSVTLSTLSFGVNPLPANSSTTVSVTVSSGGVAVTSPVSVVFSSTCSTTGKATISSPVNTVAGVATATYVDKGCGASDTITATVSGATKSANLPITPASTGSVALSLTDLSTGLSATSMSVGGTLQLHAVVKDGAGVIVSNAVVSFATDPLIGSFNPTRATALTDATGTATLNLDGVAPGAATVTVTVTIGAATLTGSASYSVSSVTFSTLSFGVNPLPANSSTTVSVTVSSGGVAVTSPVSVVFSSTCSTTGKATISSPVNTVAGVATATYVDKGCGASDTITATVGAVSQSSTLTFTGGSIVLALTDSVTGLPVSNITIGSPINVSATVTDSAGIVVLGAVVTFSTNAVIGSLIPVSGTALTDATGIAKIKLDGVVDGAATITATAQIGTAAVTASTAYSVGAAVFTMLNPMVFGVNPLSANGSTSVSVDVFSGGVLVTTPVSVTFSSLCSVAGTATLSSPVTTVGGIATATYTDKGCGVADTVTASVAGVARAGTLTITPPSAGSISFISAVPAQIGLKGTGGAGRQETSIVTFKLLDIGGNPLAGKVVSLTLSTTVGGILLNGITPTLATPLNLTTNVLGLVTASVSSGVVSTPVRVIATSPGTGVTLQTLSGALTITTGIPDQDSVSLSATKLNIEGWAVDGTTTVLTMRLSDHFNNPVQDGTAVTFVTEGGQIVGTCSTVAGACTSTLTSANPRPANGRVTVLAYAVGEESFIDLNGNGMADNAGEMLDINGISTDLAEAFSDYNENGLRDPAEPFIDFNNDGLYTLADNKYSGVLCNPAAGVFCAASPNVHVRASIVIVFSSSSPFNPIPVTNTTVPVNPLGLDLGGGNIATACNTPASLTFTIKDVNGNAMPVGTTIKFSSTNGTITSSSLFVVPSTSANVATSPTAFDYPVSLKSDATFTPPVPPATTGTCTDLTLNGNLTVTVTTPLGIVTSGSVPVKN